MAKLIDLTGQKFGRLTVIDRAPNLAPHTGARWNCVCECGNKTVVNANNLKRTTHRGGTKSCGCFRTEVLEKTANKLERGQAAFNSLLDKYKKSAKQRGYTWNLTKEQFRTLTKNDCYYCGVPPEQEAGNNNYNGTYTYNGIDRLNNDQGYDITNVISCCKRCNRSKGEDTLADFGTWIDRLIAFRVLKST